MTMLKDISELVKKSENFVRTFISECSIEEKIDTYYVGVDIKSRNNIAFLKSNGKVIDRNDLIINEMWQQFINDWTFFKSVNEEWFAQHVGYTIYMFYFPCQKPLMTKYKDNIRYLIDRVVYKGMKYSIEGEMGNLNMLDKFMIRFKHRLTKNYDMDIIINELYETQTNSTITVDDVMKSIVSKDNMIWADGEPEGYVLKYGKKYIYQILLNKESRVVKSEKSQYEYLLLDFINFWNDEETSSLLDANYIKTVCNLFNSYIINREKVSGKIEANIDVNSIQSPCLGHRFDMKYENIPDATTIALCKEKELYKNIFKILLVNLRREKDLKHCLLLNKASVGQWNEIVKVISNVCR